MRIIKYLLIMIKTFIIICKRYSNLYKIIINCKLVNNLSYYLLLFHLYISRFCIYLYLSFPLFLILYLEGYIRVSFFDELNIDK